LNTHAEWRAAAPGGYQLISLAGKRVPLSVKVFLVALATVDDLGAVLVIAFFYSSDISLTSLGSGLLYLAVLAGANLLGVRSTLFYALIGIVGVWLAFLLSGVHATIAGVLVAFTIPARTKINEQEYSERIADLLAAFRREIPLKGSLITSRQHSLIEQIKQRSLDAQTPLQKIESALHPWVTFVVIPLFALSNAGVAIGSDIGRQVMNPVSLGIVAGLMLGKFIGVWLSAWLMVRFRVARLPDQVNWTHITGVALLAGVGFTMSLFITGLAFTDPVFMDQARYGILIASVLAGLLGVIVLKRNHLTSPAHQEAEAGTAQFHEQSR